MACTRSPINIYCANEQSIEAKSSSSFLFPTLLVVNPGNFRKKLPFAGIGRHRRQPSTNWSGPEVENRQQPTNVVLGLHSVFKTFKLVARFQKLGDFKRKSRFFWLPVEKFRRSGDAQSLADAEWPVLFWRERSLSPALFSDTRCQVPTSVCSWGHFSLQPWPRLPKVGVSFLTKQNRT